ncbi:hypothetical protein KW801_03320 [Candidatus Saccharibacteria bacterium]|nr:hypothetical protein [Candidatus Saccharibacteria bacterium]
MASKPERTIDEIVKETMALIERGEDIWRALKYLQDNLIRHPEQMSAKQRRDILARRSRIAKLSHISGYNLEAAVQGFARYLNDLRSRKESSYEQ